MQILYATDGSTGADDALLLLIDSLDPSRVEMVHVLSVVPHVPPSSMAATFSEPASEMVGRAAARLKAADFTSRESVVAGHPAETIVTTASQERPDLVVLGTHGLTGIARRIIGSVSGKVAAYAPVSVLVAHDAGPLRQILFGYDGSSAADGALRRLIELPLKTRARVTVCVAYEAHAPLASGLAPTMLREAEAAYDEEARQARATAEAAAAEAVDRLVRHGVETDSLVVHGRPRDVLPDIARRHSADLVVVGSRGLSAIKRFLLGSTSAALVAEPPTSVLIGRDGDDD